ncbi:hypothetical protein ACFQE6_29780 [Natrinema soli]|uniref:Uncharacterized protein n=2 Tax=Natrinema soli TaxID=1930624 RepID=A0ABD5SYK4_9EURY
MIDHFVETGHSTVERRDAEERLETRVDSDGQPSENRSEQPPASVSERNSNPHLE